MFTVQLSVQLRFAYQQNYVFEYSAASAWAPAFNGAGARPKSSSTSRRTTALRLRDRLTVRRVAADDLNLGCGGSSGSTEWLTRNDHRVDHYRYAAPSTACSSLVLYTWGHDCEEDGMSYAYIFSPLWFSHHHCFIHLLSTIDCYLPSIAVLPQETYCILRRPKLDSTVHLKLISLLLDLQSRLRLSSRTSIFNFCLTPCPDSNAGDLTLGPDPRGLWTRIMLGPY
jgi:hypothetical protein